MQEQRRNREIVAELLEALGVFRRRADAGSDREEADQRQQSKHEGIAGQQRGIAAHGAAARGAQNAGDGVRIKEQRQRRPQSQSGVNAIGAGGVGTGHRQEQFRRRHRGENLGKSAKLHRHHDHGGERRDVDQNIFDDSNRSRRAQTARIGEGRQDDKGNEQRQIRGITGPADAEAADHDLQADQLQRDVRHRRDDAGNCHRQCEPAVTEAAAHEIAGCDVVVLVADIPEPRKHQKQDRVDHDRVGHREESDGAGAEGQRRDGNEGVGGVEIATDQEPGDESAEAPPAKAPFVQLVEIALAPMRGDEAQPGDKAEQHDKDDKSSPINFRHGTPPEFLVRFFCLFCILRFAIVRSAMAL